LGDNPLGNQAAGKLSMWKGDRSLLRANPMRYRLNRTMLVALCLAGSLMCFRSVHAQQGETAAIGFLTSGRVEALNSRWVSAFENGLKKSGYVEGQNVTVKYRGANDDYGRLDRLAAEFVRDGVKVIVAAGGPVSALAAKRATSTIPIVFTTIADPVKSGVVDRLNKPSGNATGTAGLTSELDAKRLELLSEIHPKGRVFGVLVNPRRPGVEANIKELEAAAAQTMRLQIVVESAGPERSLEAAFESLVKQRVDGLVVTADPFFNFRRADVIALATRYSLPAIYQWREFVTDGGLMSYGPSIAEAYQQAGDYAGRLLKGAKIEDLPVVQPDKFELVINRTTAKTLGLQITRMMIARADEITD
jgi:putative ABC transport system substrate-binding protein